MEKESILWKIKKLLHLADGTRNSNTEEAASAAAKAQEMMFKYNLDMADVDGLTEEDAEVIGKDDYIVRANRNSLGWKGILLGGICSVNFCRVVHSGGEGSSKMTIFGKPSNVQVGVYLYEYLEREIGRLAVEGLQENGIFEHKAAWGRSFCMGAVHTVLRRLKEQRRQDETSTEKCTALVMVSDKQLDAAVRAEYPHLQTVRRTYQVNGGYGAGQRAGEGIGLHRGVGQGVRRQIQ